MQDADIQSIVLEGEGRAEVFSFRPENVEKEKRGNLFLVGYISKNFSRNNPHYYVLNSIAAILKKEYYSPSYVQPTQALEAALKKANASLSKLPSEVSQSLELLVLTLCASQVSFSYLDSPEVLLLRENRLFRLIKNRGKRKGVFQQVVKGRVRVKDKILLCTSTVAPWLTNPSFIARLIKRSLPRVKDYLFQERKEVRDLRSLIIVELAPHSPEELAVEEAQGMMEEVKETTASPPPISLPRFPILEKEPHIVFTSPKKYYLREWQGKLLVPFLKTIGYRAADISRHIWQRAGTVRLQEYRQRIPSRSVLMIVGLLGMATVGLSIYLNDGSEASEELSQQKQQAGAMLSFSSLTNPFSALYGLFMEGKVFVIGEDREENTDLYEVDAHAKSVQKLAAIEGEVKGFTYTGKEILILTKSPEKAWEVVLFNAEARAIKKQVLTWPIASDFIREMTVYENNLYILEGFSKQIIKYRLSDLTKPTPWIAPATQEELKNALSFAIDGSIYLIDEPGSLKELRLGKIARALTLPTGLKADIVSTLASSNKLYLFDTVKGEMVLIDKATGNVSLSLTDSRIIGMKQALADEGEGLIRIITATGMFTLTPAQP